MKRLLLFVFVVSFIVAQAQSQTPSQKRPKISPRSTQHGFVKPPHSWFEKTEGDSSAMARQDERLRNSLPPHLRGMKNLPPHILAETRWLLQSEAENSPTSAAGLEPSNPLDWLYPPHMRTLARKSNPLQNDAPKHLAQSSSTSSTQILSGGVQEAWVARYDGLASSDDYARAMAVDAAGNVYVTGYSQSLDRMEYVTVKYNATGIQQWIARYNGPGNTYDTANALGIDAAGNVYVTGRNGGNYATIKYNSAGTQQWVATYNGPGNEDDYAIALVVDGVGNVYVTGSSGNGALAYDYATIKYNSTGTPQWVATYNGAGNGDDYASALAVDGAGNAYVTGVSWNGTNNDYATVKYNSAGTQEWVATHNGPRNGDDFARDLTVDGAGNVYVTGFSTNSSGAASNYATVKYNSAGLKKWVKIYNGPENGDDVANALAVDDAGNIYVAGYSYGAGTGYDYATIKYNSAGTQQWVTIYNGPRDDYLQALAVDKAGNLYVVGYSNYTWPAGSDYVTIKYNSAGSQEWIATYNGPGYAQTLATDGAGNVYVTGFSSRSETHMDYATVKYDASGVEQWTARHDELGSSRDFAAAMVIDSSGNVYVTGSYGGWDYLTVKYDADGVQQWVARCNDGDFAVDLAVDGAGNVYVTGSRNDGYATVKYNSAGTEQWVATYTNNRPESKTRGAVDLAIDGDGKVYVTGSVMVGSHHSDGEYVEEWGYATVKYDSFGDEEWVRIYGHREDGYAAALAVDGAGNVYVTGGNGTVKYNSAGTPEGSMSSGTALAIDEAGNVYVIREDSEGSNGYSDYITIKHNSAGQKQWDARYNGPGNSWDQPSALAVDGNGNVYVTGHSIGAGTGYDYATIKYNSAGTQEWVATYHGPGNGDDLAIALVVDDADNVYVTGNSWNSTNGDYTTIKYNAAGTQQWVVTYNGPGNEYDMAAALAVDGAGNVYVAGSSIGSNTGSDFATIKYTQISPPIADAGPDKKTCAGGSVQIGGSPTGAGGLGGPYAFSWSPTTGLDDPSAPNPIASPTATTTYTVTVTETVTSLSATDEVTVTVPQAGWSIAHIVDVDDVIFGINQDAAPRANRGLALSPDDRFLYLGYTVRVRKIDLSVADPAHNHSAVVAQLKLPQGTQPPRDIATDDVGRVYLALGTKIEVYNSNLQFPPLHTIAGFTACEGVTTRRESGKLVVYVTDRLDKTLERFALAEGAGEAIVSSNKSGLDDDGEVRIIGAQSPRGLDIASNGTAWIADRGNGKIYRVNSAGKTIDSTVVKSAMDIAIDETRGEVYVSQYTRRTLKVLNLSTGKIKRTLTPPAADLNVDLDGETGAGALSGIDVASCQRVFVANEKGRSTLIGSPPDSPFSNIGDNNNVKAADTDPVLLVTGNVVAKESEVEESEVEESEVAKSEVVTSYELAQNYPNPFNPSTTIRFALPEAVEVSLKIYDVTGQLVQTLVAGVVEAGRHQVVWDGTNQHGVKVASGVYFYQLRAGEFKQVRKMSLVR